MFGGACGRAVFISIFFCLVWVFIGVFWLVPDLVGGLPNSDRAVVPHPALRIILAAFMLLSVIRDMGYGLLKQMSQPSRLFEERLRSEISPNAAKLAVAVQLFDGRSEELWKFVHAQGIWLSVMGIAVDSRLPGKVAPVMASIVGAVAWALARSL